MSRQVDLDDTVEKEVVLISQDFGDGQSVIPCDFAPILLIDQCDVFAVPPQVAFDFSHEVVSPGSFPAVADDIAEDRLIDPVLSATSQTHFSSAGSPLADFGLSVPDPSSDFQSQRVSVSQTTDRSILSPIKKGLAAYSGFFLGPAVGQFEPKELIAPSLGEFLALELKGNSFSPLLLGFYRPPSVRGESESKLVTTRDVPEVDLFASKSLDKPKRQKGNRPRTRAASDDSQHHKSRASQASHLLLPESSPMSGPHPNRRRDDVPPVYPLGDAFVAGSVDDSSSVPPS
jgi:hypothetical protein